jgi:hypothetical protein
MAEINRVLAEELASDFDCVPRMLAVGDDESLNPGGRPDWILQGETSNFADLSPVIGSEQGGFRPVFGDSERHRQQIQSHGNSLSAITSQIQKARLPTHVELTGPPIGIGAGFGRSHGASPDY